MATQKKKSDAWPKVVVGSHLTVTTYENGKTELLWDDEALARDVREALKAYESTKATTAVKPKTTTRRKKVKDEQGQ